MGLALCNGVSDVQIARVLCAVAFTVDDFVVLRYTSVYPSNETELFDVTFACVTVFYAAFFDCNDWTHSHFFVCVSSHSGMVRPNAGITDCGQGTLSYGS